MKDTFKDQLDAWYENAQQIAPVRLRTLTRKKLVEYFGLYGLTKGAEIGVDRGRFSEYMFKVIPDLYLLCIDPWYWKLRGESRYQSTVRRLEPYNATTIRETSMRAVVDVPTESLDFVFIDGDHTFDYVMSDIIWWSRRVRYGGVVALHDHYRFRGGGVVQAVEAYTREHGIDRWFLTDERTPTAFWVREPFRFELDQK